MVLEEMFQSVTAILESHNKAVDPKGPNTFDPIIFLEAVKSSGGTTLELVRELSHEDIARLLEHARLLPKNDLDKHKTVAPMLLAKAIAKIFRGAEVPIQKRRPTSFQAERMTPQELLEAYDPFESDNAVGNRLSKLAKGQAFLVYMGTYNETNPCPATVNVEVSLKLLNELRQHFPPRTTYNHNGTIYEVMKVGDRPDETADENPLYAGRALRPDGECDQTGRSWAGVPLDVRQLCREIVCDNRRDADVIMDLAVAPDAFNKLSQRYRDAFLRFKKAKELGQLPSLRIRLSKSSEHNVGGYANFGGGRRVRP